MTISIPNYFLHDDFFSFNAVPYNERNAQQLKNYILFKAWCKYNNYCMRCTLENIEEPVLMDEDIIPNCPYCDTYYYEECKEAQERADRISAGLPITHLDIIWDDVELSDVYISSVYVE